MTNARTIAYEWASLNARLRGRWLRSLFSETEGELFERHLDVVVRDDHVAEMSWRESQPEFSRLRELDRSIGEGTPANRARDVFGIDGDAFRLMLVLAACRENGTLESALDNLCDGVLSLPAVARIIGIEDGSRLADSRAVDWGLLSVDDGRPSVDAIVTSWVFGEGAADRDLLGASRRVQPREAFDVWPMDEAVERVGAQLEAGKPVRLVVRGGRATGRRTFAANVVRTYGLELRSFAAERPLDWMRHAFWAGWAPLLDRDDFDTSTVPLPPPIRVLIVSEGEVVASDARATDVEIELGSPDRSSLQRVIETNAGPVKWAARAASTLVGRERLRLDDLAAACRSEPESERALMNRLNALQRRDLGPLVTQLDVRFEPEDLILDAQTSDALDRLHHEACLDPTLRRQAGFARLYGARPSVIALFHGPSGTGKTMAAQILAAKMGLDIFRVDLSAVVSKWVGETMKNLRRVLSGLDSMDAILFFDEADSIFGSRTDGNDANDRHLNTDTNFLLQALEDFGGIAILASNRRHQLDTAFGRRFRHVIPFERPRPSIREQMWRSFLGQLGPWGTEAVAFASVLSELDLSGAEIKGAIMSALVESTADGAESIGAQALLDGLAAELQKLDRGLSRNERERLQRAFEEVGR